MNDILDQDAHEKRVRQLFKLNIFYACCAAFMMGVIIYLGFSVMHENRLLVEENRTLLQGVESLISERDEEFDRDRTRSQSTLDLALEKLYETEEHINTKIDDVLAELERNEELLNSIRDNAFQNGAHSK